MIRVAMVIGSYPAEEQKRREDVVLSYRTDGLDIGLIRLEGTPYVRGITPTEIELLAPAYIAAFSRAEREGYDAVVPFGVLDIGVEGGRSAVDIPVIGPAEACFHVASLLGERFGLLVYNDPMIGYLRPLARRYRMEERVVAWTSVGLDLPDMAANADAMRERFVARARALIDEHGADVIVPMGVSQCPVHIAPELLRDELGVPVVEGIGAPLRMAGLLAGLGHRHSRRRWPRSETL